MFLPFLSHLHLKVLSFRFRTGCDRGYLAALTLVCKIAGGKISDLDHWHRGAEQDEADAAQADEDELQCEVDDEEGDNECLKLLESMQAEARVINNVDNEGPEEPAANIDAKLDADLRDFPDKEEFKSIVLDRPPEGQEDFDPAGLPRTLTEALSRPGDMFNALWRLAVKIRSSPGGMDRKWIRNPQNCRRASAGLNWHQCLVCASCCFRMHWMFVSYFCCFFGWHFVG